MTEDKPKILVLFYSMYGHVFRMAESVVEGVREAGGEPKLMQVAELVPQKFWDDRIKTAKESMKDIPIADPRSDLAGVDGLVVGTPTRFGNMCSQMRNFWDQTGGGWVNGILVGKPAAVFTSTGTQHGGQETTIISVMLTLLHHGCVVVGLPNSFQGEVGVDEVCGGSPYGASTIAGPTGGRMPSEAELRMARNLGRHLTLVAGRLRAK